ncbi:MAG: hypothetical protein HDR16_07880 [Lachnospiraceae bacterium]|nr:hypothetical protein [Lachnospiraceae bacterium]
MEYPWYELIDNCEEITQGDIAKEMAFKNGKRLRLCPPYREHLSQAFARYFMRVGLPVNIHLE